MRGTGWSSDQHVAPPCVCHDVRKADQKRLPTISHGTKINFAYASPWPQAANGVSCVQASQSCVGVHPKYGRTANKTERLHKLPDKARAPREAGSNECN